MSKKKSDLSDYRKKRNLKKSPEPKGKRKSKGKGPIFVVQWHHASSEHWDFRLEVEGTLKSWAVPKGPSTDPKEKRLAVQVEDHPLDYADFEGVIPEGEYGAGTVMVWDTGPYRNLKEDDDGEEVPMEKCVKNGHLTVWLEGEKIKGGYALTQMKGRGKKQWLLVKMDDEKADARRKPTKTETKSVKTGRTMKQIERDEGDADKEEDE